MSRISYVNGRYVPHAQAMVSVEDRGYQFSDGVYEYLAFYNRTLLDEALHWRRLERSLKELSITPHVSINALSIIAQTLIEKNGREHGGLYLQITRGVAKRDHVFPRHTKSSLVMTVSAPKFPKPQEIKHGVKVITYADNRWARRDIKSVSLLANVLAKQEASHLHAREAWLVEGDFITEGAVSNAYIITKKNELITHPADKKILAGITREMVLQLAKKAEISVIQRPFSLAEAFSAAEAFITSTSANVLPVISIDGKKIGGGAVGLTTKKLQELYAEHVFKQTEYRF